MVDRHTPCKDLEYERHFVVAQTSQLCESTSHRELTVRMAAAVGIHLEHKVGHPLRGPRIDRLLQAQLFERGAIRLGATPGASQQSLATVTRLLRQYA